jgi:hypothetical protein
MWHELHEVQLLAQVTLICQMAPGYVLEMHAPQSEELGIKHCAILTSHRHQLIRACNIYLVNVCDDLRISQHYRNIWLTAGNGRGPQCQVVSFIHSYQMTVVGGHCSPPQH